jgi:hypothetical protein
MSEPNLDGGVGPLGRTDWDLVIDRRAGLSKDKLMAKHRTHGIDVPKAVSCAPVRPASWRCGQQAALPLT